MLRASDIEALVIFQSEIKFYIIFFLDLEQAYKSIYITWKKRYKGRFLLS